jgi:RNA polymerase primary sigma factor
MTQQRQQYHKGKVLGSLLEKADLQGYLTSEDILEVHPWGEDGEENLKEILKNLRGQGVEIVIEGGNLDIEAAIYPDPNALEKETTSTLEHISADDSVGLYLKEMSRVPLLSLEEEVTLAKLIEQACEAKDELAQLNGRGTAKRRQDLENVIHEGLLAREHLIKANTRLVVSIAKRFIGRGVPLGFRFSTYATWWIRQTITRSIADQGRTIRIPVHMTDRIRMLYKTAHKLEQKLGHPPTPEELSEEIGITSEKVQWMLQVSRIPISLESPVGDEDDSEFGMFVEDNVSASPSQTAYENMLSERVEDVLSTLTPREARILRLRFGLENGHPYTLEEVGQKFGLTRERIRQIEGKALRRLRHPCRSRLLKEYL